MKTDCVVLSPTNPRTDKKSSWQREVASAISSHTTACCTARKKRTFRAGGPAQLRFQASGKLLPHPSTPQFKLRPNPHAACTYAALAIIHSHYGLLYTQHTSRVGRQSRIWIMSRARQSHSTLRQESMWGMLSPKNTQKENTDTSTYVATGREL